MALAAMLLLSVGENSMSQVPPQGEAHRPLYHFTPARNWMNDPNGLVYQNGIYHLFFQHHPGGNRWGPMHWGHAMSRDLLSWEERPIALYPDSLGYIFSGSVVVDTLNRSGFGREGRIPLVAVFTHHNPVKEENAKRNYQYQSLAYSLDYGNSWTKFTGNPVLENRSGTDFRDPKVLWHAGTSKWVMALATRDRVTFFSSPDLKSWARESEFGERLGAHGGVWECPDLFPLPYMGRTIWALLVSINPGAPNGGSGTQYFLGDFDGRSFVPFDGKTRWIDHGTDNYAGVTFSNIVDRRVFIGWMSNWDYGQDVPTESWRSAMTTPRELFLKKGPDGPVLCSKPTREFEALLSATGQSTLSEHPKGGIAIPSTSVLDFRQIRMEDFSISLSNDSSDLLVIGYEASSRRFYIDRSSSGHVSFSRSFPSRQYAPRADTSLKGELRILLDAASVEVFADGGSTVMTAVFFPRSPMDRMRLKGSAGPPLVRPVESTTRR